MLDHERLQSPREIYLERENAHLQYKLDRYMMLNPDNELGTIRHPRENIRKPNEVAVTNFHLVSEAGIHPADGKCAGYYFFAREYNLPDNFMLRQYIDNPDFYQSNIWLRVRVLHQMMEQAGYQFMELAQKYQDAKRSG